MFFKSKKNKNDYPMNEVYNGPATMGDEPHMACVYAGPEMLQDDTVDVEEIFIRDDEPPIALAYDVPIVGYDGYPNSKEEPPVQLIYGCPEVMERGVPVYSQEPVCNSCGRVLETDFVFCPYCGKKLVRNV